MRTRNSFWTMLRRRCRCWTIWCKIIQPRPMIGSMTCLLLIRSLIHSQPILSCQSLNQYKKLIRNGRSKAIEQKNLKRSLPSIKSSTVSKATQLKRWWMFLFWWEARAYPFRIEEKAIWSLRRKAASRGSQIPTSSIWRRILPTCFSQNSSRSLKGPVFQSRGSLTTSWKTLPRWR